MIKKAANYQVSTYLAHKLIRDCEINNPPIDIIKIIKKFNNIKVLTYEEFSYVHEISYDETISLFCSKFGACTYNIAHDTYLIFVNSHNHNGIIRFTLAHEFGHIILGHFNYIKDVTIARYLESKMLTKQEKYLENEADCFARNILAPIYFYNTYSNPYSFYEKLEISQKAALSRKDFLSLDFYNLETAKAIIKSSKQIANFKYNLKCCPVCLADVNLKDSFCHVCGSQIKIKAISKEKVSMKYKHIAINPKTHRPTECLKCQNEEIEGDDEFCKICGTPLHNYCSRCGNELDGNSRFCPSCGNTSPFFDCGLLPSWKEEIGLVETPKDVYPEDPNCPF